MSGDPECDVSNRRPLSAPPMQAKSARTASAVATSSGTAWWTSIGCASNLAKRTRPLRRRSLKSDMTLAGEEVLTSKMLLDGWARKDLPDIAVALE